MRVLIVEDNAAVRSLLRHAMVCVASEVWEREDGVDALEGYTLYRPDVVLMDIRMPRMDGLTATRLILKNYPDARVVVITDYEDENLRIAAEQCGARAYVLKENLTELASVLTSVTGSVSHP
jgi:two-component system response regulator DegU